MIKEIIYNGFSASPSDYECPDGDLAGLSGLVPEDGAIKPILPDTVVLTLDANKRVYFIHKNMDYTHYIIFDKSTSKVSWVNKGSTTETDISTTTYTDFQRADAIGNVLMLFTSSDIHYFLWKPSGYKYLGNKLPEASISFSLVGHPRLYSQVKEDDATKARGTFTINFNGIGEGELYNTFSDENKTKITGQVMAKVNKFIAEQTINKGRFCFPFLVRWAYRLYDGTHTRQSSPILMNPSTFAAPVVLWKRARGKGSYTEAELDIMMVAADLEYRLNYSGNYYDLDDWKDIIVGIDIFVSKPIYTYDQSGEVTNFSDDDNFKTTFIGRLYNGEKDKNVSDTTFASSITEDRLLAPIAADRDGGYAFLKDYCEWSYAQIYQMYFSSDRSIPMSTLHMPEFSDSKNAETVKNTANFYLVKAFDIDEVINSNHARTIIDIGDEYLQSLVARQQLTDDYLSHDRLIAGYSHGFNSRLNLAGVKRELFNGFPAEGMLAYCTKSSYISTGDNNTLTIKTDNGLGYGEYTIVVYIRENGVVRSVSSASDMYSLHLRQYIKNVNEVHTTRFNDGSSRSVTYDFDKGTKTVTYKDSSGNITSTTTTEGYIPTDWGAYVYYPNANAFKMVIYQDISYRFDIDLKTHEFLNGAFAFLGYQQGRKPSSGDLPSVDVSPTISPSGTNINVVSVPNKIYTSEVNNPFYFPVTNINTVGTGNILGISTAAKALSEGQFGQFPLYAFTDEGVWALEVSDTGTYKARQPITRDVCINSNSITQIDSAVLFATERGIMLLSGSESKCISDILNAESAFNPVVLKGYEELLTKSGYTKEQLNFIPFKKFLAGCAMLYDYNNQRVIVYNPNCKYAYVYSLKDKKWGMRPSDIADGVNSYPEAMAMTSDGKFIDLSNPDEEEALKGVSGIFFTRPLKLDMPNVLKTVDTVIQRGYFRKGHVAQVLYGSVDLFNWHLISSSKDQYLRGFFGTPYKYFVVALVCHLDKEESLVGCTVQYTPRLNNQPR